MDKDFMNALNRLLVETYSNVNRIEAEALKRHGEGDLSITEFHILEAIAAGGDEGRTVGEIAQELAVTFPTITVAVGKLERKGCVNKQRSADDGRVVRITLTRQGRRMNAMHRYFHESMIRELCRETPREELDTFMTTLGRLNDFLYKYTENRSDGK